MTYVVVEFPVEIRSEDGTPTGNCRGWVAGDDPALGAVLAQARVIGETKDPEEARRMIEAGRCVLAERLFEALAGMEVVGIDPGRVRPRVWEHIRGCATCTARYQEVLESILPDGGVHEPGAALGSGHPAAGVPAAG